jgi:hypothetical protein
MKVNKALIGLCPVCKREVDLRLAEPAPLEIEVKHFWESPEVREAIKISPIDLDAAVISWTSWVDYGSDGRLPICDVTVSQYFEYWMWMISRGTDYHKAAEYATGISWLVYTYWQLYDAGFMACESVDKRGVLRDDKRRKRKYRAKPIRCDERTAQTR